MLPFGVTIPATVPQGSEIPEGLMNNPVYKFKNYKTVQTPMFMYSIHVKIMASWRRSISCKINYLIFPSKVGLKTLFRYKTIRSGRCGVYGKEILIYDSRISD